MFAYIYFNQRFNAFNVLAEFSIHLNDKLIKDSL